MTSIVDTLNGIKSLPANEQRELAYLLAGKGYISLPINAFREASAFDVLNTAGNGGVFSSETTPILSAINDATDGQQRLAWAASNNDQIVSTVALPKDLDTDKEIKLYFTIASAGTTNAVGFTVDSFFGVGDTKVVDTSGTNQTATYAEVTATIAAADIPSGADILTVGLTPVAHTTDIMYMVGGVLVEYTKSLSFDVSR